MDSHTDYLLHIAFTNTHNICKIYNIKLVILTILSVHFIGVNFIHNIMQPSPLPVSKLHHYTKQKLCH